MKNQSEGGRSNEKMDEHPMPCARIAIESVLKILITTTKCQWFWLNFSQCLKIFPYDPRMEIILDIGQV